MSGERILIVDDEKGIRASLSQTLRVEGLEVEEAEDGAACLEAFGRGGFDLVLLDVKMPGLDGLAALRELRRASTVPVVMMSAHATVENAVEATKLGAHDFLEKPLSSEKVLLTIRNTLDFHRLAREHQDLRQRLERRWELVGESAAMRRIRERIERLAPSRGSVLVTGESGTGKELVARAIHRHSDRASGPFVSFNCAAIPVDLAESELFGHERGAFTGATKMRPGKFEQADRGTLFLDEVGDLKLDLQAKLLRVLQEGEFQRVGSSETKKVDVRVVAATNQDLDEGRRSGTFREDLFFRINVLPFPVPPLRERTEDLAPLIDHFLTLAAEGDDAPPVRAFDEQALRALRAYPWPGNIRELKNLVDRILILVPGDRVTVEDVRMLLPGIAEADGEAVAGDRTLKALTVDFERRVIQERLREKGGNMTRAAEDLGLERSHLYKKMKSLGISRD